MSADVELPIEPQQHLPGRLTEGEGQQRVEVHIEEGSLKAKDVHVGHRRQVYQLKEKVQTGDALLTVDEHPVVEDACARHCRAEEKGGATEEVKEQQKEVQLNSTAGRQVGKGPHYWFVEGDHLVAGEQLLPQLIQGGPLEGCFTVSVEGNEASEGAGEEVMRQRPEEGIRPSVDGVVEVGKDNEEATVEEDEIGVKGVAHVHVQVIQGQEVGNDRKAHCHADSYETEEGEAAVAREGML